MNHAIVIAVRPPIVGQAGMSFHKHADERTCYDLYTSYIEELALLVQTSGTQDLWLSCEDHYQSTLVQQRFPHLKRYFITPKTPRDYLPTILHQACIEEEYKTALILLAEFSFIAPDTITKYQKLLVSNARTMILFSHDGNTLDAVMTNFPFQHIYQDIIWQKTDTLQQLTNVCKDAGISHKINKTDLDVLANKFPNEKFTSYFPRTYAIIRRQFTHL